MKEILNYLFEHNTLSRETAREVLGKIAQGGYYNESQVAAFLTVFMMRSVTVEELSGFRDAMLELCVAIDLDAYDAIDLCGTGGDSKDTFNVSTLASFVAAGAGVKVAKHGNYGVSSVSGSSNMIEYFGYQFTNDPDHLRRKIETTNICFLHAPLFHPAMKNVGPIRRALGVKTFFNMLGPMVNPAFPKKQLVGVFSLELARLYGYLYQKTDKHFVILHSLDGYDEISLTGGCKQISRSGEKVIYPQDLGLNQFAPEELFGGKTVEEAARIFERVLKNEGTEAQTSVVLANAGMAIHCARPGSEVAEAMDLARTSLESGKALATFKHFIAN
jgi:anthranilate phosphoribosyltransferase